MTVATLATTTSAENRRAVVAGTIGNVLEWYDFGVYGYLATTMSQLFFPGDDKTISLLKAFAVFGVGFVMRPVGSILFGVYGDRFGRRLALSAVIFLMAFSPLLYRVTTRTEHDRDRRGRGLGCERGGPAPRRDDHAHPMAYEISR